MTEKERLIFSKPKKVVNNGSDGVDDDPFTKWKSPEEAELYA